MPFKKAFSSPGIRNSNNKFLHNSTYMSSCFMKISVPTAATFRHVCILGTLFPLASCSKLFSHPVSSYISNYLGFPSWTIKVNPPTATGYLGGLHNVHIPSSQIIGSIRSKKTTSLCNLMMQWLLMMMMTREYNSSVISLLSLKL